MATAKKLIFGGFAALGIVALIVGTFHVPEHGDRVQRYGGEGENDYGDSYYAEYDGGYGAQGAAAEYQGDDAEYQAGSDTEYQILINEEDAQQSKIVPNMLWRKQHAEGDEGQQEGDQNKHEGHHKKRGCHKHRKGDDEGEQNENSLRPEEPEVPQEAERAEEPQRDYERDDEENQGGNDEENQGGNDEENQGGDDEETQGGNDERHRGHHKRHHRHHKRHHGHQRRHHGGQQGGQHDRRHGGHHGRHGCHRRHRIAKVIFGALAVVGFVCVARRCHRRRCRHHHECGGERNGPSHCAYRQVPQQEGCHRQHEDASQAQCEHHGETNA